MPRKYIKKRSAPVYSSEQLQKAVHAVKSKSKTYREASSAYGVPVTVIYNRISGRKSKCEILTGGRSCIFSKEEENDIVTCIRTRAQIGYPCNKTELLKLIADYIKKTKPDSASKFKDGIPGDDWYRNFMKRNPILSLEKTQNFPPQVRINACHPSMIYDFYNKLSTTFEQLCLFPSDTNSADLIYNCNEIKFTLNASKLRAILETNKSQNRVSGDSEKESISVLACVSASGQALPPLIMFKAKSVQSKWVSNTAYPGTTYECSENGWMTETIYGSWFEKSFIAHVQNVRKNLKQPKSAVLIFNAHASHVSMQIVQLASANNITLIRLPSHSTDILQPLDEAVFGPFKTAWNCTLLRLGKEKIGTSRMTINKNEFVGLLGEVWTSVVKKNTIKNGFENIGLFPVDKEKFPKDKFDPNELKQYEIADKIHRISRAPTRSVDKPSMSQIPACSSNSISSISLIESNISTESNKMQFHVSTPIDLKISISRSPKTSEEMKNLKSVVEIFFESLKEKMNDEGENVITYNRRIQPNFSAVVTNEEVLKCIKNAKLEKEEGKYVPEQEAKKKSSRKREPEEKKETQKDVKRKRN